jgi:hypothetical protein
MTEMGERRALRKARLDILRDMVDGEQQLRRLITIVDWLERKASTAGELDDSGRVEPLARPDQVQLMKIEMDLRLKLLNKVLPDLKAVEHSGEIDTGPTRTLSRTELKHRVGLMLREIDEAESGAEAPALPFLD